ncbi:hypothetical protein Poli38472_010855 [Pythium oligandrum]|uniref:Uncharacterized protein n=1 Tax=Pythium oligandrum TaxID=41045 RepID=A0A8K1CEF4_PYTOL|nr:hypothetical protein Poli38472_010855 [Pythium oligandrum]|eukprot:TMW61792.1 hypothetical protein Poli38472_010855 [Pythium oligandrum]
MATALPTCSGVWFRLHCRHQQLFQKEYKRSNRNRGTKILRCFPHCCPSHVERSYCGSSLELAVDLHQPLTATAQTLFVFARFETVDFEQSLRVGQQYSLRHLQSVSQSESNPEAPWVQGVMQSSSQHTHRASSNAHLTRVFLLNGQTSSKWYYHWESGANKARRLTKHVLRAYILHRRASEVQNDMIQVISIVCSPPFTLVSYRRAAWEGLEIGDGAGYAVDESSADYALQQIVQNQISQAFQEYQKPQRRNHGQPLRLGTFLDQRPRASADFELSTRNPDDDEEMDDVHDHDEQENEATCERCRYYRQARPHTSLVVQDQWAWERQHHLVLAPLRDLAIIYAFVTRVSVLDVVQSFRVREHLFAAMHRYWPSLFESNNTSNATPATIFSAFVSASSSSSRGMHSSVEDLFLVVSKLVIWAVGDESVHWLQKFCETHSGVLLHKPRLRVAFLHGVEQLCKRLHKFWSSEFTVSSSDESTSTSSSASWDSTLRALRGVSDKIIALVNHSPRYQSLWPTLRELLERPDALVWAAFVAQMRESYTRTHVYAPLQLEAGTLLRLTPINGAWVIQPPSLRFQTAQNDGRTANPSTQDTDTLSLWLVLLSTAQSMQFRLALGHDGDTLYLRNENTVLPMGNPWMMLVCDSQPRVSGVLPMGLASLLGEELFGGDYKGSILSDQATIRLELYWWPFVQRASGGLKPRRLLVTLEHDDMERDRLDVSMELQSGELLDASRNERRLELCSPSERMERLRVRWASLWVLQGAFNKRSEEIDGVQAD